MSKYRKPPPPLPLFDQPPEEVERQAPPVRDIAFARSTDPETSHAAAASLSSDTLRVSQAAVLAYLKDFGPSTDHQMVQEYPRLCQDSGWPQQSPSGLRTRRRELADGGLVMEDGKVRLPSGRMGVRWRAK